MSPERIQMYSRKNYVLYGIVAALFIGGILANKIPDSLGLVITAVFLGTACLLIFGTRWRIDDTSFRVENFLYRATYLLTNIKKIYVAELPNDSEAGSTARPVVDAHFKPIAVRTARKQLWLDYQDGEQRHSIPLLDVHARAFRLRSYLKVMREMEGRLPSGVVDQSIWNYFPTR